MRNITNTSAFWRIAIFCISYTIGYLTVPVVGDAIPVIIFSAALIALIAVAYRNYAKMPADHQNRHMISEAIIRATFALIALNAGFLSQYYIQ